MGIVKNIVSLTDYINAIKEILSVSDEKINEIKSEEYIYTFYKQYFDNKLKSEYISKYEGKRKDINTQIDKLLRETNAYMISEGNYPFNKENDDKYYVENQRLLYNNKKLFELYKELDNINMELNYIRRKKSHYPKDSKKKQKYVFYYRGQHGAQYDLLPKIMRESRLAKESYIYHEIMVNCANNFAGLSHLDKLVLMQHYDCPTRLLDVTRNPLVALYFACKNFNCEKCKNEEDGKIFIFAVPEDDVVYGDSDRGLMLACLPKFSDKDKKQLLEKCEEYMLLGKNFDEQCQDSIIEKFLHEVRSELPAFRKNVNPEDLVNSLIIQPNKSNARILRQDGAFIISGLSKNITEEKKKLKSKVYAEIKIDKKDNMKKILEDLDKLGINEATLFPEIDNVAHYLQEYLMS